MESVEQIARKLAEYDGREWEASRSITGKKPGCSVKRKKQYIERAKELRRLVLEEAADAIRTLGQ